jgi:hypothetical protein
MDASGALDRQMATTDYVALLDGLFAPATRGHLAAGPPLMESRAGRELLPASRTFRIAAEAGLNADNPLEVAAAEVQLLGGAALDLLAAARLAGLAPSTMAAAARNIAPLHDGFGELRMIIQAPEAYLLGGVAGRASVALQPGPATRALEGPAAVLSDAVHAALADIRHNVVVTSGHILQGALLLDAAVVREALDLVGEDILKRVGLSAVGASASVVELVLSATEKIGAVLGRDALPEARRQLSWWLSQLRDGALLPALADRVLRTKAVEDEIKRWLAAYAGAEDPLFAGREEINALAGRFAVKARLAARIAAGLALVKIIPVFMSPPGRIATAAGYLGLLAFVVGSGHDHIDSGHFKLLDRVEGVRAVCRRVLLEPDLHKVA